MSRGFKKISYTPCIPDDSGEQGSKIGLITAQKKLGIYKNRISKVILFLKLGQVDE
jgi:hypothetical protein